MRPVLVRSVAGRGEVLVAAVAVTVRGVAGVLALIRLLGARVLVPFVTVVVTV
jgi:hypothetical protein